MAKELELIRKRGKAPNVSSWPALSRWTVSPFWLGESLARGEALGLAPADQQRLASAVGEARGSQRASQVVGASRRVRRANRRERLTGRTSDSFEALGPAARRGAIAAH